MRRSWIAFALSLSSGLGCAHTLEREADLEARLERSNRDDAFLALADEYAIGILRRNPVVSTYLGAAGRYPELAEVDGLLRDHSIAALADEDAWLASIDNRLASFPPDQLSPERRIDREVMRTQIAFLLHQHQVRRAAERAIDTYNEEPFRGLDFQLQGLTALPDGKLGTREEWERVIARVSAIPAYLKTAEAQIRAGIERGNTPDGRMIRADGLDGAEANAKYLRETFVALADRSMSGAWKVETLARLGAVAERAALAFGAWRTFLREQFFVLDRGEPVLKAEFSGDRFAVGEAEYDFALENNLQVSEKSGAIYDAALPEIEATRAEMVTLARAIAARRGWTLPSAQDEAVRFVIDRLSEAHPSSDEEMFALYRAAAARLVDFGRRTGMFDVPPDYRLEIAPTPGPLGAGPGGAAYYPAPPFKETGVGRFLVSPTGNDPDALARVSRDAVAVLAVHEGFPGHDWQAKVMAQFRSSIHPVRWLTPGAVEDSSSMWQDSMSSEGWALYAESLMAEPRPGAPSGFYTPEERLFQLQSRLFREIRVVVDVGLHTGRMTFDEAVDWMSAAYDFLPGACREATTPQKRASCRESESQIFRYSKWPTQAITYALGKDALLALREELRAELGARFSERTFHLAVMKQGAVPPAFYREAVRRELLGTPADAVALKTRTRDPS